MTQLERVLNEYDQDFLFGGLVLGHLPSYLPFESLSIVLTR